MYVDELARSLLLLTAMARAARVLVVDCVAAVGRWLLGHRLCLFILFFATAAICLGIIARLEALDTVVGDPQPFWFEIVP